LHRIKEGGFEEERFPWWYFGSIVQVHKDEGYDQFNRMKDFHFFGPGN